MQARESWTYGIIQLFVLTVYVFHLRKKEGKYQKYNKTYTTQTYTHVATRNNIIQQIQLRMCKYMHVNTRKLTDNDYIST